MLYIGAIVFFKFVRSDPSYLTQIAEEAGDIVGLVMQRQMIVKFQGGTQYQLTAGKRAWDLHRGRRVNKTSAHKQYS
jgi:hypothetical protein